MRKNMPKEMVAQWTSVGPILDALGSTIRLNILMMFEPGEKINIKSIVDQFDLSRTAVVHHINALQESGILKSQKMGKEVFLTADFDLIHSAMNKVLAYIELFGNPQVELDGR